MPDCTLWPVSGVEAIWPHLAMGFDDAALATGGDIAAGELWQGARRGDLFLIVAHDGQTILGASLWKPETWRTGAKLRCMGLFGTGMKDWIGDMHAVARRIAKDCGATSLISEGRTGWKAIFPNARVLRSLYEEPV